MSIKRIFHDPIHKEIVFDSGKPEELMIMELIDTIAFQRLRRIKQLGAASLVFHGAESSRFTHSIGVFCIARKIYKRLIESKSSFCDNKFALYGAALLHDLGHGPLSHTSETIFDHDHEKWSQNLVKIILQSIQYSKSTIMNYPTKSVNYLNQTTIYKTSKNID